MSLLYPCVNARLVVGVHSDDPRPFDDDHANTWPPADLLPHFRPTMVEYFSAGLQLTRRCGYVTACCHCSCHEPITPHCSSCAAHNNAVATHREVSVHCIPGSSTRFRCRWGSPPTSWIASPTRRWRRCDCTTTPPRSLTRKLASTEQVRRSIMHPALAVELMGVKQLYHADCSDCAHENQCPLLLQARTRTGVSARFWLRTACRVCKSCTMGAGWMCLQNQTASLSTWVTSCSGA